jgi:hypothetical protein
LDCFAFDAEDNGVGQPLLDKRTSVEHLVFAEGFKDGGGDSGDGNGVADDVEDFERVPPCVSGGA